MDSFDGEFLTFSCPGCGYLMDAQLLSFRLQERVFCSCCKETINLVDKDASVHGAQRTTESALKDFGREIEKLEKALRIEL